MESAFIFGGNAGAAPVDGLSWANLPGGNAVAAWDFLTGEAVWSSAYIGALSNTPGWSFARASTGYAQTSAGALTAFASGELRRTDKGVLIEGARTNLCLQSQTFDNASWTKQGGATTVTANATTAPDGTVTADLFTEDSALTAKSCYQSIAAGAATYTGSVYVRAGSGSTRYLRLVVSSGTSDFAYMTINMATGAITQAAAATGTASAASGTVQTLSDGWFRVTVTTTLAAALNFMFVVPYDSGTPAVGSDYGRGTYTGNGSTWSLWGAQLEAASFPSSYIPTTTASATRAADVLTVPVSGLDYPLSLFAEFERAVDAGGTEDLFQVYATNNNDRAKLYVGTNDRPSVLMTAGGVSQGSVSLVFSTVVATSYKLAGRFGTNTIQVAQGGSLGTEDTTATAPTAPNTISFGRSASGANPCFGYLRRIAIFPRALTDAELTAVTGG